METIYTIAALWLGLAVFSAIIAHHLRISIALVEICIGVVAANIIGRFFGPNSFGSNLEWLRFLASTGLTFGTISALYGYSHAIVTQEQYSFLVATVIASAVIPTLIANFAFLPHHLLDQKKKVAKLMAEGIDEE